MAITDHPIDALFVSEKPLWPLDQGYCIHGYNMATALHNLGKRVVVTSMEPPPPQASSTLHQLNADWPTASPDEINQFMRGWRGPGALFRRRLARFQGVKPAEMAGIVPLVKKYRPQAVIGLGQHSPMILRGIRDIKTTRRVWYAADEMLRFQLSCLKRELPRVKFYRLVQIVLGAALEGAFTRGLDAAIGVNPTDTSLLRWVAGARRAVTIRNGVDLEYYHPAIGSSNHPPQPPSLVFWGRMDFEPNIDAVTWFANKVWPRLRWYRADATWQIVGMNPHPQVRRLSRLPGVQVLGEVPDVRPYAHRASVVVLPLRCGGGIKNKLLEAAAMGRPVVASARALEGLEFTDNSRPALQCDKPDQWVDTIRRLWSDTRLAASTGHTALAWVKTHHTWQGAAESLSTWLDSWGPTSNKNRASALETIPNDTANRIAGHATTQPPQPKQHPASSSEPAREAA